VTSPDREPRIAALWGRVILLFVVFLVLANLFTFFYILARGALDLDPGAETQTQIEALAAFLGDPRVLLDLLLLQALAGLLTVLFMTRVIDRRSIPSLGFQGLGPANLAAVGWGLLLGFVLAAVVVLFISAAGGRHVQPDLFRTQPGSIPVLVAMLVGAALMEEWFFRGYLFVNLRETFSPGRTILLTAIAFATIHATNPGSSMLAWINIFLVGVVLGQLRELTGGIPIPFGLHLGWNAALGMGFGVRVSGIQMPSVFYVSMDDLPAVLSGGEFGPEASAVFTILFSVVAFLLARRLAPPPEASL
jgi:membrane protease YdiL (CAAX protease family)